MKVGKRQILLSNFVIIMNMVNIVTLSSYFHKKIRIATSNIQMKTLANFMLETFTSKCVLFGIFLVCLPHIKFCIVYQFLLSFPFVQHANVSLWLESIQAHLPANLSHILQAVIISDAIILSPSVQLPLLCVLKLSVGDLFALSLPQVFVF